VASIADELKQALRQNDGYIIERQHLSKLENLIFKKMNGPRKRAEINRDLIGKNADSILSQIGISVPASVRLGVVEVDEDHPLIWTEQMMPIMPLVRVPDADRAIDLALEAEGGCYHTAVMHSKNLDRLHRMARECNCSIFVKNGRAQAGLGLGGEGYTSFTIASPTGEGLTNPVSFSRWRRCTLTDKFRIV
jgi:acyl-CoA reductase-like NAD-dependent aldehyde dehydrogenase